LQVLDELRKFETLPGTKPFANLKPDDLTIINYHTTLFDGILPGSLKTDTEVGGVGGAPVSARVCLRA
jgi:hypothetical protein